MLEAELKQAMLQKIFPPKLFNKPGVNLIRVFVKTKAGAHEILCFEVLEVQRG